MTRRAWIIVGIAVVLVVGIVGLVRSFTQYMRHAYDSEPELLDLISRGAAAYYTTPHFGADSKRLPCQFPQSVGLTPATSCCSLPDDPAGDDACEANEDDWNSPTWKALRFHVTGRHYYRFEFLSSGTGADAKFAATAYGDLDCDGELSTYKLTGIGVDAPDDPCSEVGIKPVERFHEYE